MMPSPALKSPRADLISEAARSFLELTKKAPCGTESSAERNTQDCAGTIMVRKKDKLKTRYYPDQNRPLGSEPARTDWACTAQQAIGQVGSPKLGGTKPSDLPV